MIVGFSVAEPDAFFTTANFQVTFGSQAVLLILSIGLMIALIAGEFDLSVAGDLGFRSQLVAVRSVREGIPIVPAIALTLLVAGGVGAINALLVVRIGVPSIVATLGTGTLVTGLSRTSSAACHRTSPASSTRWCSGCRSPSTTAF